MTGYLSSRQHIVDVMETLSVLFRSSPESSSPVERRLSACWKSLLRIKVYEEVRSSSRSLSSAAAVECS